MRTHLFYHQETVEWQCALNSWLSIRDLFSLDDEVIILDLGNTLKDFLPFSVMSKYVRIERIRTDKPEERSYTFGLNTLIPSARGEWICLWRSDYIYHKKFFSAVTEGMRSSNVVIPYEAFIGAYYCGPKWCMKNFDWIRSADEESLIKHSHVCPVYEMMDFPHFAIKKDLWLKSGGMDTRLWGYGYQFPELFYRLKKMPDYKQDIEFDMISFHQNHAGSFGLGILDKDKNEEVRQIDHKLLQVFGDKDAVEQFKKDIRQKPLRSRYPDKDYNAKLGKNGRVIQLLKRMCQ
jgi:hypothetical protein